MRGIHTNSQDSYDDCGCVDSDEMINKMSVQDTTLSHRNYATFVYHTRVTRRWSGWMVGIKSAGL